MGQLGQLVARQVQEGEVGELTHPIGQRRQVLVGEVEVLDVGGIAELSRRLCQLIGRTVRRGPRSGSAAPSFDMSLPIQAAGNIVRAASPDDESPGRPGQGSR